MNISDLIIISSLCGALVGGLALLCVGFTRRSRQMRYLCDCGQSVLYQPGKQTTCPHCKFTVHMPTADLLPPDLRKTYTREQAKQQAREEKQEAKRQALIAKYEAKHRNSKPKPPRLNGAHRNPGPTTSPHQTLCNWLNGVATIFFTLGLLCLFVVVCILIFWFIAIIAASTSTTLPIVSLASGLFALGACLPWLFTAGFFLLQGLLWQTAWAVVDLLMKIDRRLTPPETAPPQKLAFGNTTIPQA